LRHTEILEEKISYYRLKISDIDAKSVYSNVISILNNVSETNIKLFPNPASSEVCISLESTLPLGQKPPFHLVITDLNGKVVLKTLLEKQQNTVFIGNLTEGLYFWEIKSQDEKEHGKLVIQR
jgi:hypothetical protein